MQFNPTKCTVIHIASSRCKPRTFDYFLCNQKLSTVDSNPYLGVAIARTLSWNNHINNIVKRANSVMGLVKRTLYSAPKETKILAYQSIVRPTIEYTASIWDPSQPKISPKWKRYRDQQLDLLQDSLFFSRSEMVIYVYLLLKSAWPIHQAKVLVSTRRDINTSVLKHTLLRTLISQRTIVDWNALPPVVIEATTTNQFKKDWKPIWTINNSIYF